MIADNILVKLEAEVIGGDRAIVQLESKKYAADGIDILVSIKLLEYELRVETFYYGFNLHNFVEELTSVIDNKTQFANLFNYDETLILKFIHSNTNGCFLLIQYESCFPEQLDDKIFAEIKQLLSTSPINFGTRFSMSFLNIQGELSKIRDHVKEIVSSHQICIQSPYK